MNAALILRMFWEFFKIGLFAVGGGPATLPYLMELTERFDWFTMKELTNMIAVSESTPGPLGLNMATYAGFQTLGNFGGLVSTLGLVLPSIIIICVIAEFFARFNKNPKVQAAFKAIRAAVTAIIGAAVIGLCKVSLFTQTDLGLRPEWKSCLLCVIVLVLLQNKNLKKLHPFLWFVVGAAVGLVLRF